MLWNIYHTIKGQFFFQHMNQVNMLKVTSCDWCCWHLDISSPAKGLVNSLTHETLNCWALQPQHGQTFFRTHKCLLHPNKTRPDINKAWGILSRCLVRDCRPNTSKLKAKPIQLDIALGGALRGTFTAPKLTYLWVKNNIGVTVFIHTVCELFKIPSPANIYTPCRDAKSVGISSRACALQPLCMNYSLLLISKNFYEMLQNVCPMSQGLCCLQAPHRSALMTVRLYCTNSWQIFHQIIPRKPKKNKRP